MGIMIVVILYGGNWVAVCRSVESVRLESNTVAAGSFEACIFQPGDLS